MEGAQISALEDAAMNALRVQTVSLHGASVMQLCASQQLHLGPKVGVRGVQVPHMSIGRQQSTRNGDPGNQNSHIMCKVTLGLHSGRVLQTCMPEKGWTQAALLDQQQWQC